MHDLFNDWIKEPPNFYAMMDVNTDRNLWSNGCIGNLFGCTVLADVGNTENPLTNKTIILIHDDKKHIYQLL